MFSNLQEKNIIFFPLVYLPQRHPAHENLHNVNPVPQVIFELSHLQYDHLDRTEKKMSRKYSSQDNFVVLPIPLIPVNK